MADLPIPVVDLFAGPGGLGEGFSRVGGPRSFNRVFKTVISIEKEPSAVETLRLRALYRMLKANHDKLPEAYLALLRAETTRDRVAAKSELEKLPEWKQVVSEIPLHESGRPLALGPEDNAEIHSLIRDRLEDAKEWVLIGGPPCQAYSLVGRSRMQNHDGLKADHRHFLYKEYLAIITKFKPSVFVMENVKGLNTAKVNGKAILPAILADLKAAGYTLHSIASKSQKSAPAAEDDFLIKSELYGVPQTRHRVIIIGTRCDIGSSEISKTRRAKRGALSMAERGLGRLRSKASQSVPLHDVIGDLPPLDGLSSDIPKEERVKDKRVGAAFRKVDPPHQAGGKSSRLRGLLRGGLRDFQEPVFSEMRDVVLNHEARSHMQADLDRYEWWAENSAEKSPTIDKVPLRLRPKHANLSGNVEAAAFADRFKVQIKGKPCGTITSHISKDGHYYIHYDPSQRRSFSVREAARVQTFPDDYFFMGNRTQQYHQVGNAVPPYLAYQIGQIVAKVLGISVR